MKKKNFLIGTAFVIGTILCGYGMFYILTTKDEGEIKFEQIRKIYKNMPVKQLDSVFKTKPTYITFKDGMEKYNYTYYQNGYEINLFVFVKDNLIVNFYSY